MLHNFDVLLSTKRLDLLINTITPRSISIYPLKRVQQSIRVCKVKFTKIGQCFELNKVSIVDTHSSCKLCVNEASLLLQAISPFLL